MKPNVSRRIRGLLKRPGTVHFTVAVVVAEEEEEARARVDFSLCQGDLRLNFIRYSGFLLFIQKEIT